MWVAEPARALQLICWCLGPSGEAYLRRTFEAALGGATPKARKRGEIFGRRFFVRRSEDGVGDGGKRGGGCLFEEGDRADRS